LTQVIEAARDTATDPAMLNAFALAIVADGDNGYPGWRGNKPALAAARRSRTPIHQSMDELRIFGTQLWSVRVGEQLL